MAVTVDLQQACEGDVPETQLIQRWAESALKQMNEDCELSIRLVDESESAELN